MAIERLIDSTRRFLLEAIKEQVFPGCVLGLKLGRETAVNPLGRFTYDRNSPQVTEQTIYDVASLTKAIPVSTLALKLIEDGMLNREGKLISFVPEFTGSYRDLITINHLLTHTLDFSFRLSDIKDSGPEGILGTILSSDLRSKPGERFCYANATSILLGLVLERCTGKAIDLLASEIFFNPLGMNSTFFHNDKISREMIAPTEIDPWRGGVVQGEVHDESAWVMRPRVVGSAGLFSTVPDMLRFVSMLLEGGILDGRRYFKQETVRVMYTNQLSTEAGTETGLGWELNQKSFMGELRGRPVFGKTGFTGCAIIADPEKNAGIVLLCNHIFPRRRENRDQINRIRIGLADIVFSGL